MSDFSFTASAQCQYCGNLLASSDEECDDCDRSDRAQQFFRKVAGDDSLPKTISLSATIEYKWDKLEAELGDDWIAYEWLGPREDVRGLLKMDHYTSVEDVPRRATSLDRNI